MWKNGCDFPLEKHTVPIGDFLGIWELPWNYLGKTTTWKQGLSQDFINACPKQQFQNFARPDLATYLLQILIPATSNSLVCQKWQFILQLWPRRWLVRKIFGYYTQKSNWKIIIENFACPNRRFLGNYLSKRQVGRVLVPAWKRKWGGLDAIS